MARPGALKRRIEIFRTTTVLDDFGGSTETLTTQGSFWASVERLSGSRSLQYQELGWSRPFEIVLRADIDVQESDEIEFEGMTLVVQTIERDYNRFRFNRVIANARDK